MIFASFIYEYIRAAPGNTRDTVLIDMNFRALYQINPDHLIVLGFASVVGQRKDAGGVNINVGDGFACRLIGNFNETFNVPATIVVPRPGDSISLFNGIAFSSKDNFVAPEGSQILMPPDFQVEFDPSSWTQVTNGDTIRILCSIGYKIVSKRTRF